MTIYKFDIMVNGRFYHTMRYEKKSPLPLNMKELYDYIVKRLPTLKQKEIDIYFHEI